MPGGENGGAKLVALELAKQLAEAQPETQFIILTTERNDGDLASLDAANVSRHCVRRSAGHLWPGGTTMRAQAERIAARLLPVPIKETLSQWRFAAAISRSSPLVRSLGAQLLFCPFTAPFHHSASVPTVSIINDLQFLTYPQFFKAEDRLERSQHFQWACRVSAHIVCPSEYTRGTVLRHGQLEPDRVRVIPHTMQSRLARPDAEEVSSRLAPFGLERDGYLFYPANFWRHKNHEMLLTAFGIFLKANPSSQLKLALTGAPDQRQREISEAVVRFGLTSRVVLPGFVDDTCFAALLHGCLALIFPSLYEGFGMPVLEAMAIGKAVLCSNLTSLPEVAGDAAMYFDPRSPYAIAEADPARRHGPRAGGTFREGGRGARGWVRR